jgi:hypothetical protein
MTRRQVSQKADARNRNDRRRCSGASQYRAIQVVSVSSSDRGPIPETAVLVTPEERARLLNLPAFDENGEPVDEMGRVVAPKRFIPPPANYVETGPWGGDAFAPSDALRKKTKPSKYSMATIGGKPASQKEIEIKKRLMAQFTPLSPLAEAQAAHGGVLVRLAVDGDGQGSEGDWRVYAAIGATVCPNDPPEENARRGQSAVSALHKPARVRLDRSYVKTNGRVEEIVATDRLHGFDLWQRLQRLLKNEVHPRKDRRRTQAVEADLELAARVEPPDLALTHDIEVALSRIEREAKAPPGERRLLRKYLEHPSHTIAAAARELGITDGAARHQMHSLRHRPGVKEILEEILNI